MSAPPNPPARDGLERSTAFARQAEARPSTFAGEMWGYLRETKKWWLSPLLLLLLVLSVLGVLAGSGAAPLIYALF